MIKQIEMGVVGIMVAVAVALSGLITWGITVSSFQKEIDKIERKHADIVAQHERDIGAIQSKAQEETAAAIARMKAAQDALAELDRQKTEELVNAKAENDLLRNDVVNGSRSVRLIAEAISKCGTSTHTTSGNTSTSSVVNGTAVELTPASGKTVLDIREGIINDQAKVNYLQSYVRDIVRQCKKK